MAINLSLEFEEIFKIQDALFYIYMMYFISMFYMHCTLPQLQLLQLKKMEDLQVMLSCKMVCHNNISVLNILDSYSWNRCLPCGPKNYEDWHNNPEHLLFQECLELSHTCMIHHKHNYHFELFQGWIHLLDSIQKMHNLGSPLCEE